MIYQLHFSHADIIRANREWGCNCGPGALAAALGLTLNSVRGRIPGFESKRYTSPSMMADALRDMGQAYRDARGGPDTPCPESLPVWGLVRVQFGGPWTAPGANPKWAYCYTHWIASAKDYHTVERRWHSFVADINGGLMTFDEWVADIVPLLLPKRGDGRWWPTHTWHFPSPVLSAHACGVQQAQPDAEAKP